MGGHISTKAIQRFFQNALGSLSIRQLWYTLVDIFCLFCLCYVIGTHGQFCRYRVNPECWQVEGICFIQGQKCWRILLNDKTLPFALPMHLKLDLSALIDLQSFWSKGKINLNTRGEGLVQYVSLLSGLLSHSSERKMLPQAICISRLGHS